MSVRALPALSLAAMMERKRGTGTVVYDLAKKVKEQGRLIKQRRQHFLKVPWEAVEDLLQLDYPWFYKALAPPDTLADADGFTVSLLTL